MLLHYEVIHIIIILGTVSTAKRRGQGTTNERGIIIMIITAIHIILLIRYCFYCYTVTQEATNEKGLIIMIITVIYTIC